MTDSTTPIKEQTARPTLTIRRAHYVLLLVVILVATVGTVAQAIDLAWGLWVTELALILAPALLLLRVWKLPVRETLRLHRPRRGIVPWSIVIGLALVPIAVTWAMLMSEILGYTLPITPEFYPDSTVESVVMLTAMVALAGFCEEVVFRGVVLRAYLRRGVWFAIIGSAILFALFHLSLLRLFALVPVALTLSYVGWRSDSLWSPVSTHASYNLIAGGMTIVSTFRPDAVVLTYIASPLTALVGLVFLALGIYMLRRQARPAPLVAEPPTGSWLGRVWPLGIVIAVFVFMASIEVVIGAFPQALALQRLALDAPAWGTGRTWRYAIMNPLEEPVGEATITVEANEDTWLFQRVSEIEDFQVQVGRSYYQAADTRHAVTARWSSDDLLLLEVQGAVEMENGYRYAVERAEDGLLLTVDLDSSEETLTVPNDALLEGEWPWRLAGMPWTVAPTFRTDLLWPLRSRPGEGTNIPVVDDRVAAVRLAEPLATPAGRYIAWRVTLGENRTAWYDAEAPHDLLRYEDDLLIYELTQVDAAP
jgi:hypothetical protein